MKLRLGEKIFIILALVLVLSLLSLSVVDYIQGHRETRRRSECFETAKQDIIAEYGFEAVVWLDIEEVKIAPDREDFYIFTCIADDEDNLREYRFAVQIRIINGEIDVDTWRIKEAT